MNQDDDARGPAPLVAVVATLTLLAAGLLSTRVAADGPPTGPAARGSATVSADAMSFAKGPVAFLRSAPAAVPLRRDRLGLSPAAAAAEGQLTYAGHVVAAAPQPTITDDLLRNVEAALVSPTRAGATTPLASVKKTDASCTHAHAILGWSDFKRVKDKYGKGEDETDEEYQARITKPWRKVGWIVGRLNWGREKGQEYLLMVDDYNYDPDDPNRIKKVEFKEYGVKGHSANAKAYVAHCYGGMCNMIAERFYRLYKGIGVPQVVCGKSALPSVIHNGRKPVIELPSDDDLAEAEDDDWDDDWDDGDDDDDDDW
ncbi:MAG: hypothetical protein AAGN82_15180 [Myxococcota bacterium]